MKKTNKFRKTNINIELSNNNFSNINVKRKNIDDVKKHFNDDINVYNNIKKFKNDKIDENFDAKRKNINDVAKNLNDDIKIHNNIKRFKNDKINENFILINLILIN